LNEEFQREAYPKGYSKAPATGAPTNLIASRLGALRHMHQKGVTKVKIPTRKEQAEMEYLKGEMRGEEQKGESGSDQGTPSKQSYFARFIPKLPRFGSSSKERADQDKKGESSTGGSPKEGLVRVLE